MTVTRPSTRASSTTTRPAASERYSSTLRSEASRKLSMIGPPGTGRVAGAEAVEGWLAGADAVAA